MSEVQKKQLKVLEKQKLRDMEHKISADVSSFIVFLQNGNDKEIDHARNQARADLLKWGKEMQAISQTLGGNYPEAVDGFLNTMDTVLHCKLEYIDQAKISKCYHSQNDLEKML